MWSEDSMIISFDFHLIFEYLYQIFVRKSQNKTLPNKDNSIFKNT